LFEHDLFRKTGTHFSGSCSSARDRIGGGTDNQGDAP
jgi:hypothetical protein